MGVFKLGKMTMRSLFKKAPTRRYPYEKREPYPRTRGQIDMIDIHKCIFCGACQRKCPADCIVVEREESRWTYSPYKCIACDSCVRACPVKDLESLPQRPPVGTDATVTRVYELTEEEKAEKARIAAEKKAKALAAAKARKEKQAREKAAKEAAAKEAADKGADTEEEE